MNTMDEKLVQYLKNFETDRSSPLSNAIIQEVEANLEFKLPNDYIEFVKEFDGGEGEVGKEGYLRLFLFEELIEVNGDYSILMEQIPDYFLLGKDAAVTGYAFHKFNHTYHEFGLMANFRTDAILFCGNTFYEFIDHLYNS